MRWVGSGVPAGRARTRGPLAAPPRRPPTSDPGQCPGNSSARPRAPPPSATHSPDAAARGLPSSPQLVCRNRRGWGSGSRSRGGSWAGPDVHVTEGGGGRAGAHVTAGRRPAGTAAMRCSRPACWVLLLVAGLCCVHRARPRNVLLILGKFRPAGTPGTALHGRRKRPALSLRALQTPLPFIPRLLFLLTPDSSWSAPWRGKQRRPCPLQGLEGSAPAFTPHSCPRL